jgi:hypothetical protein
MKPRPANPSAVKNQFDEWAKAVAHGLTRRKTLQLLSGGLTGALLALGGPKSWAASSTTAATAPLGGAEDDIAAASARKGTVICRNQEYALCAGVRCFVYNNVAYCRCDLLYGDSISRSLSYAGGNVCTVNAEGPSNGFVVSTFSVPTSIVAPFGNQALYFCPPTANPGAYASCDGGICFASTRGQSFPGLGQLGENQIVCSCPITMDASGPAALLGHQIFGPYPCQASFFKNCTSAVANTNNGTTIYEGAPTGSYGLGALQLSGKVPRFNMCFP